MTGQEPSRPQEILEANVDPMVPGRYYITAELFGWLQDEQALPAIESYVDRLDDHQFWRTLAGLSHSARLNGVFWWVGNERYQWNLERWNITDLVLTGMGDDMNPLLEEVGHDPNRLRKYMKQYYGQHKNDKDDPKGLKRFRESTLHDRFRTLLLREQEGKALVLDGMHRTLHYLATGVDTVTAYRAVDLGTADRWRLGEGAFALMNRIARHVDDDDRKAVARVVEIMQRFAVDREEGLRYWKQDLTP